MRSPCADVANMVEGQRCTGHDIERHNFPWLLHGFNRHFTRRKGSLRIDSCCCLSVSCVESSEPKVSYCHRLGLACRRSRSRPTRNSPVHLGRQSSQVNWSIRSCTHIHVEWSSPCPCTNEIIVWTRYPLVRIVRGQCDPQTDVRVIDILRIANQIVDNLED
jgi:hypothetical protein